LISAFIIFLVNYYYYLPFSIQIIDSLIGVAAIYSIKYAITRWFASRVFEEKTQFSFRRFIDVIFTLIVIFILSSVWIEDPTTLIVSSGIIGAGLAIALQDVFRNLAGGLLAMFNNIYKIGDRIEINGNYGDVLGVGLFNTTLLEIREWIDGDQATGRLLSLPNSVVLSGIIKNYTKEFNFIWDEIRLPITYDSNWKEAYNKISDIVKQGTKEITMTAQDALKKLGKRYYLTSRQAAPFIYITLTDNWIDFKIRYITKIGDRRKVSTDLSRQILEEIQKSDNIQVASSTMVISGKLDFEDGKKK
jgi:small-conductance mechanosensitive channel